MSAQELFQGLREAVVRGDVEQAVSLATQVVTEGIDALAAYEQGLRQGISEVGEGFAREELFLPDLIMAADAMKAASAVLEQEIRRGGGRLADRGKVVLGTVSGDLHDIGKTIVATLFSSHGFEVIDLGVDVAADEFVRTVKEEQPQILGMSSLLTVTAKQLGSVIEALEEAGLRDNVKVIVGGGAVTEGLARAIGADGYGENAELGVRTAKSLLGIDH